MAAIPTNMGEGGANVAPQEGGSPTIASALRDVADDLADVQSATIAAPETLAFTDPPSAAEMALLRTLVNEMRAALIATGGATLRTIKA